jgi:hypothetical protein
MKRILHCAPASFGDGERHAVQSILDMAPAQSRDELRKSLTNLSGVDVARINHTRFGVYNLNSSSEMLTSIRGGSNKGSDGDLVSEHQNINSNNNISSSNVDNTSSSNMKQKQQQQLQEQRSNIATGGILKMETDREVTRTTRSKRSSSGRDLNRDSTIVYNTAVVKEEETEITY